MLAELLTELRTQVIARVEALVTTGSGKQRLAALYADLLETLRRGHVEVAPCPGRAVISQDTEALYDQIQALARSICDLVEEHGAPVPPRDMRLLAEWFSAVTEATLRGAYRRLAAVADAVPDHLALFDPATRVIYMNRSAAEFLGPDAAGHSVGELGFPEPMVRQIEAAQSRVLAGETATLEVRFPTPSGAFHWREGEMVPVFGEDGKVEAIALVGRDIEKRKTEQARLQLLDKLSRLAETNEYEHVIDGLAEVFVPELADCCIVDVVEAGSVRRGKVTHVAPAKQAAVDALMRLVLPTEDSPARRELFAGRSVLVTKITDGSREDPYLRDVISILDPTSVLIVPFCIQRVPVAIVTLVMTQASQRRYGQVELMLAKELAQRAAPLIDNARLHRELMKSESRFRIALAAVKIGVFEQDRDLRYLWYYNPSTIGIDYRGKTQNDLMPAEDAEKLAALKRRVIETGEPVRDEIFLTLGPGEERLCYREAIDPLRDPSGAIIGVIGAGADITDEKRAQDELTQELVFRERMMGVLGHDLRNPLGAVIGLAEVTLLQGDLPEVMRDRLRRIDRAARRMTELIETLLDVTRMRFGQGLPIERTPVDLRDITCRVVDELRAAHPARTVRLEVRGDVHGQWDAGRLGQLLSNLVGNALTHGSRDTPVDVDLIGDDRYVTMEVTNQGPAIPPALLDRLFQPFQRGPGASESRSSNGLGLGLFVARQVVVAHRGTIDVRSTEAATTFSVRLERCAPSQQRRTAHPA